MSHKKKQGVGQNKNFGPIQKLSVPDFQHINNVFEQMQSEILEKPSKARKQMKPFTIRKATGPKGSMAAAQDDASADPNSKYTIAPNGLGGDRQGQGANGMHGLDNQADNATSGLPQEETALTPEEIAALQPKRTNVVNPWIHEQTHKEFLQNIVGLPARHANVIKKHKTVVKETTFLPKDENILDKDKATRDALAILDKEYEIFQDPQMLPVKALTRYDTWDNDHTPAEWLARCQAHPHEYHGISPVFDKGEYGWKPVKVISYDEKEKKFKVQVGETSQTKMVTRLSLLFYDEDPDAFKQRVNQCKERQRQVEAELRFTNLVDSVPSDAVSVLSKERRERFMTMCMSQGDNFDPDFIYSTFNNLMRVIQEEYIRQMKKCIIIKEMQDPMNHERFVKLRVPIRLSKRTNPYFGVVRCPKYPFLEKQNDILHEHWCSDDNMCTMTRIFCAKYIDEFQQKQFYVNTNQAVLKLPRELKDMKATQNSHHSATQTNMLNRWRDFLVGEIQDRLGKSEKNPEGHDFNEESREKYQESLLRRVVLRFELIMNSYLRDFVKSSIDTWVTFIKSFTIPKYDQGELWARSQTAFLTIHINQRKPIKDKKKNPKKARQVEEGMDEELINEILAEQRLEEDDYINKIQYDPTLQECQDFMISQLINMVETTNKFHMLEYDLMQNLPHQTATKTANFPITEEFPWIVEAKEKIAQMCQENMTGPNELLAKFAKYEYLLNIDRKQLLNELFNKTPTEEDPNIKVSLNEIRQQLLKFETAEYEIQNISNDVVDFPLYNVQASKIKERLSQSAQKSKDAIVEAVSKWCSESTQKIQDTYMIMKAKISTPPTNEKELVAIKEFIKVSKEKTQVELTDLLKDITKHQELLDEFSWGSKWNSELKKFAWVYEENDIENTLIQKTWPMVIGEVITDGNQDIQLAEEQFGQRLETEKEEFVKQLEVFAQNFNYIKTFSNVDHIHEFNKLAYNLSTNIGQARYKIEQFNEREQTFSLPISEYPKLDEVEKGFKPFYDLLDTSQNVTQSLNDWTNSALMTQEYDQMESSINQWHMTCFQLDRKLRDDFPDTAAVALIIKGKLEKFREFLPLIKCITSEAIGAEDWDEIKVACNNDSMDRDQITVLSFTELKLQTYFEQIDEITSRAEKKFQLQKKLKTMRDEMKAFTMTLFAYKGKTFIIKAYDEANAKLDDQLVMTQSMNSSSNMRGKLKLESKAWEAKLKAIQDLLQEVALCQGTWMYLEPIFASDDIGKTMPTEAALFRDVDQLWKTTMDQIEADPGILEFIERDNIFNQFQEANRKLEKIKKSLNDYLEEKRLVFARFYFLADTDLLMLLAQTKDPRAVQPHMDKCFEAIQKVVFSDNECVLAMVSAEGETVQFNKAVDVNEGDKKGNVEKWMLEIETVMRKTLKQQCRLSLADYYGNGRNKWVSGWPGQIILAVDQIDWTTGVEKSIPIEDGLDSYRNELNNQIDDLVKMVRGELPTALRITLKALVVIDVHARDVVSDLIKNNVQSTNDFSWASQLRYYWTEKGEDLKVSMVTATIDYGWEYLGNSLRLVITPLTDRCYRTLMGAKQLNYGGAPEGPAGTGKTESVKDLAKALAVQCVVFNCSDGLDYLAMGKFFKGLASAGCWNCFDEFNRIDLEVLSVIAQQVLTIQTAIVNKQRRFMFEGTDLQLNRACSVNITMNPGYAGRSELPDNLKALFRTCAMMVPDYTLIGEIDLYSYGFSKARYLAVKIVSSLTLSSEQLSSQDHYDFGMRALKAILTACGNLFRQLDWPEDQIGLRALNDVNLPKFTSNDIPLYKGITSDLFPGIVTPAPDYNLLLNAMTVSCKSVNLQPKPDFLNKCIQLYETIMVRHGLMVVGGAYSGKTKVIEVLKLAMSSIKDDPLYVNVVCTFMNPKSILQTQLYGWSDKDTGEWTDGVLAISIRNAAESTTPDRKWVIFDGPVDAVWIENMNTVLDDNKKLCLNSGQIIKLKPTMTMMFEVEDLSQASPATVSRCGMVLLEPQQLGFTPLIQSYIANLATYLDEKVVKKVDKQMHYFCNLTTEFCRTQCSFPVKTGANFWTHNYLNIFDLFVSQYNSSEVTVPNNIEEICMNALVFAAIWGIGGQIDENSRSKYDTYLQELINGEDVQEKYQLDVKPRQEPMRLPNKLGTEFTSLFEMSFIPEQMTWINWIKTQPPYQVQAGINYTDVIVPTVDSIRIQYLLKNLLYKNKHTLIVGATGTGKSVSIGQELRASFQNDDYMTLGLSFSAQTSALQTQNIIDGTMEKKRKGVYGPALGKTGIIFVDDLNMPQPEKYGAQPPIELLRQWMDYGGWYDFTTVEKDFRQTTKVRFCAAMGPPGGGRSTITNRYTRHFNVLYIEPYSVQSMNAIYQNVMDWMYRSNSKVPFPKGVEAMRDSIVSSTIQIYQQLQIQFRPTPAKSHYTYNLRDISKVFQGLAKSNARAITSDELMVKLWAHECLRVFSDRLISIADREQFQTMVSEKIKEKFKKDWEKLVTIKPLLFASFTPLIYPDNDNTKKPFNDIYCELTDRKKVTKVAESALGDYNIMNRAKKMDLVLFTDAIEHIVKIHRIITTELGHALLVGVGGSGRKSLTELATFIAGYTIEVLEMSKGYSFVDWRDDMKNKLFIASGVEASPYVFLFSDTQVINETFMEDINNILNNGEIPNLYNLEDTNNIIESVKEANKANPDFRAIQEDSIAVFNLFVKQAKNSLHCVLAMSPIGEDFKRRLRMFPSLVNCCAIDWFLPWPKEALQSVAEVFLSTVPDLPDAAGIISICVDMQIRVQQLTDRYREEMRRFYYVTPTSYLILIKTFTSLLEKKRNYIFSQIKKFEKGLEQLAKAQAAVGELQAYLTKLIPELEVKAAESLAMQKTIEQKKKLVDKEKEDCKVEEEGAKKDKEEADIIKKDCDDALALVMPIYRTAMEAVNSLQASDVTELKGFANPPKAAIQVARALVIIFQIPKKDLVQMASEDGKGKVPDYWTTAKKTILTGKLLNDLKTYDKDNVPPQVVIDMAPVLSHEDFTDDKLQKASKAAHGIAKWCRAIISYYEAMKIVTPKKMELAAAVEKSTAAQKKWDMAKERLAAVIAEMTKLVNQLEATVAEETSLRANKDNCERKVELAKALITGLAEERENWKVDLAQRRIDKENLVGDIVISSGVIAYLGVFLKNYRDECTQQWAKMLMEFNIKSTENVSIKTVLGDPVKIREWQIQGLPSDDFSTDSAIITEYSDRWCLFIDPQMQANIWLKNRLKPEFRVIKPTMDQKNMSRNLEAAIPMGIPVIFEDANETFDPMLDPLLAKQIEKKGNDLFIKFGEGGISFSPDFKFFITTKMSRPHYSPEICVRVTMLNFMVTLSGLTEQMLDIIVSIEETQKFEKRNACIKTKAENQKTLARLQDRILNQIATSQDDILEDKELKASLDESKIQTVQIEASLKEMDITMRAIEQTRSNFEPISIRVSRLFFVLADLINVNDMYQYSLEYYRLIYEGAIRSVEGVIEKQNRNARKAYFISEFTRRLYRSVCRSLFEKDKLLFSFLLCLKIMDEVAAPEGGLNFAEVRFLMAGATQVEVTKPNPTGESGWLSKKAWLSILEISTKFKTFKNFDEDFIKNVVAWEKIYNSAKPQSQKQIWPGGWQQLSLLHKTIIMSILRPDKVVQMIQKIVKKEKEMGKDFITPPANDMEEIYADSTNKQPIIIVLSPGADPMTDISNLSAIRKVKYESLSLGQGQGEKAKVAIKAAMVNQTWVILQNCHLAVSFMPTLDQLVEEIELDRNSQFRIWLTTMPTNAFPVTVVQNSVKVTAEPPKGIRNNMRGFYYTFDNKQFDESKKPSQFRRLLWGLVFFNALVLERRKFGPLGWNIPYEFSTSDLRISKDQLIQFLDHYDEIPYEALQYMVAEANYGGRVTDPQDRRCIKMILADFYCSDVVKIDKHKLSESGQYIVPEDGMKEDYISYIEERMPINELTEIFGMHDNAEITSAINQTNELLGTALVLQPRVSGAAGKTQEQVLADACQDILAKLPKPFDTEYANKKHPITYEESMNTVLLQEILRYNKLLILVRSSLINIGKAIKGEVVMSTELEQISNNIFDNRIPDGWKKSSYPSLKPLASYIVDFVVRLEFINTWIEKGIPSHFWISGFFFTQSFLTGIKQNFARRYVIAIDQIGLDFEVFNKKANMDYHVSPKDGAYVHGLYLEGARWDSDHDYLAESQPKILFTMMPHIWLKPADKKDINFPHHYECPIYKTLDRRGTLSTTGHSTNFVCMLRLIMQKKHTERHWVKRGVALITQLND